MTEKSTADQRCRIGRYRTPLPALLLEAGTAGLLACTAAGQYARTRPSLSLALRTNVIVSNLSRDNILFSTFIQVSFYFLGKKLGRGGGAVVCRLQCANVRHRKTTTTEAG